MRPPNAPNGPNPLGSAPLGPLIYKFAVPSIIAMLVGSIYNITDQIFIGQVVGMLGNAATTAVFPLVAFCIALSQIVGVGMAAGFNLSQGAGKTEDAKRFVGAGVTMLFVISLVFPLLVFCCKTPILLLCGATESALPYAETYLGITVLGMPFHIFANGVYPIIRADRSPRVTMVSSVIGAGLNIVLDWLFLFPLGMGIEGAAIATAISQAAAFLVCVWYVPRFKAFPLTKALLGLPGAFCGRILKLGTASFSNHLVMTIVNIVLNNTLVFYGAASAYGPDIPLAVAGVIGKVNAIMVSFIVGLAHGCQPIISFNMGAKNYKRVKGTFLRACVVGTIFSTTAFLLFQCFPHQITAIFGSGDPLYFEFAEAYLRVYLFLVFTFGVQPLCVNYFTAVGAVKQGIFLSLSRQGLFLLPLLAILPLFLGMNGVLISGPIADGLALILSLSMVRWHFKQMDRMEAEKAAVAAQEEAA